MNSNKREQQARPKKTLDAYQRQVRRNQIFFIVLSGVLILSMLISLIRF